jgi:hypothetical protein
MAKVSFTNKLLRAGRTVLVRFEPSGENYEIPPSKEPQSLNCQANDNMMLSVKDRSTPLNYGCQISFPSSTDFHFSHDATVDEKGLDISRSGFKTSFVIPIHKPDWELVIAGLELGEESVPEEPNVSIGDDQPN